MKKDLETLVKEFTEAETKKTNRRARMTNHKARTINEASKTTKTRKARKASTQPKKVAENISMADAMERYTQSILWENQKAEIPTQPEVIPVEKPEKKEKEEPAMIIPGEGRGVDALAKKYAAVSNQIAEHPYKTQRREVALEIAMIRATEAKKKNISAKGNFTKALKKYNADPTPENYGKLMMRKRHARICGLQLDRRIEEAQKTQLRLDEFKAELPGLKEELARLSGMLKQKRHDAEEELLAKVFDQRYERAEFVPEKPEKNRYKVYSVPSFALFGEKSIEIINQLHKLNMSEDPSAVVQMRKLYSELESLEYNNSTSYVVNVRRCSVNNVTGSMMSDILGVEYEKNTACKQMILVNHELTKVIYVPWKAAGKDYDQATERIKKLQKHMLQRLIKCGVVLVDDIDEDIVELKYGALASSASQQKKGQLYMGETNVLKATQKAREFGMMLNEAIEKRPDNAAEWLKRAATLLTPSEVMTVRVNGEDVKIRLRNILMMGDVDVDQKFDRVRTIDGLKEFPEIMAKVLNVTKADGQAISLIDMPSTQLRGYAIKAFLVNGLLSIIEACKKHGMKMPEVIKDIDGVMQQLADKYIIMTKSCWKAAKMGMTWNEFVEMAEELAKEYPDIDCLRTVRYSDREIGDEENPRNLARQATQQCIKVTDEEIDKLTRKTRRWLKREKELRVILSRIGEWDKKPEDRSAIANLFNRVPELLLHPYIKQYLKNQWTRKLNKAASGKLRTNGCYPYIAQDPVAMIEVLLLGIDKNDPNLGVLKAGEVNIPKAMDGQKVYAGRYPMNFIVGRVYVQKNVDCFRNVGNVAILPYWGDAIVVADGDFDGDEMLFVFDKHVIALMEKTLKMYNPPVIDFEHGKVKVKPFGTAQNFVEEVSDALFRAMEFNLVGTYSNLAVMLLQMASECDNPVKVEKLLVKASVAHVGAILCLDLVKGADVSEKLIKMLEKLNKGVRNYRKMPWNQKFSHPEAEVMPRSNSTQDRIAGSIVDDAGEFDVETNIVWDEQIMINLVPKNIRTTSPRNGIVNKKDIRVLLSFHIADDEADKTTWQKILNGEAVSQKDLAMLLWHNNSAMLWRMSGADQNEKTAEMYKFARKLMLSLNILGTWEARDGHIFTSEEKHASIVRNAIFDALGFRVDNNTVIGKGNGIDDANKGSYAMFMLHVFAEDIMHILDSHGVVFDCSEDCVDKHDIYDPNTVRYDDEPAYYNDPTEDDYDSLEADIDRILCA